MNQVEKEKIKGKEVNPMQRIKAYLDGELIFEGNFDDLEDYLPEDFSWYWPPSNLVIELPL